MNNITKKNCFEILFLFKDVCYSDVLSADLWFLFAFSSTFVHISVT